MKKRFSNKWKGSKQPRKQRKYRANAPIHVKKRFLSANLSKDLRKKQSMRNVEIRKGDTVRVMRGKHRKKQGKVADVSLKRLRIYVEGIQVKKQDGSKTNIGLRPSNLQIVELNLEDKKRFAKKSQKPENPKEDKK